MDKNADEFFEDLGSNPEGLLENLEEEMRFAGIVDSAKGRGDVSELADEETFTPADFEELERQSIDLARIDPAAFISYAFGWPMQECHVEWQDYLTDHDRAVLWAPIEHGKSSQVSVGRPIWEIGRDPEIRAAIISSSADLSQKLLGVVKTSILLNPRVKAVFPALRPEKRPARTSAWLQDRIIVQREDITNKDPTLQALGILGAIMGARLDLAILDDVLNFDNTLTPEGRKRVIDWYYSSVDSRISAMGRVWVIGTAWHVDDLMHDLGGCAEENRPERAGWESKRYDAEDGLWPELHVIDGKPVGWPNWRLKKQATIPRIEYDRQFRNLALSDSISIFNLRSIETNFVEGLEWAPADRRTDWGVYIGVDLNTRKGKRNNHTAFFVGCLDGGKKRCLEIRSANMQLGEILATLFHLDRYYRPILFLVENNAAQEYLVRMFEPSVLRQLLGNVTDDVELFLSDIPRIEPFTTGSNKADPTIGIRGMTLDFEQGRWMIPEHPLTEQWKREMMRFSPLSHTPDVLMASWFFNTALEKYRPRHISAQSLGGERNVRTDDGLVHIDGRELRITQG